ncbi:hypothetical protein [Paracoccus benzoatiresistens]|uniref:Uncharacterized protein n=1 Tax=Paracoccus benzoatiresistens TaxID=2997341 RepID=A0ABT4J229_9RHOB|nr:hypothetical protein [Paracoccus sp. EF6]MCZ0961162.1 hypothetical protein [Paracoccus sp. EF6]
MKGDTGQAAPFQDARVAVNTVAVNTRSVAMNSIIYIVGLVVIVLFILSFLGLR